MGLDVPSGLSPCSCPEMEMIWVIMVGEVTISEFIDCFRGLTASLCGALAYERCSLVVWPC